MIFCTWFALLGTATELLDRRAGWSWLARSGAAVAVSELADRAVKRARPVSELASAAQIDIDRAAFDVDYFYGTAVTADINPVNDDNHKRESPPLRLFNNLQSNFTLKVVGNQSFLGLTLNGFTFRQHYLKHYLRVLSSVGRSDRHR